MSVTAPSIPLPSRDSPLREGKAWFMAPSQVHFKEGDKPASNKHNFQKFSSIIDYIISSNITNTNYLDKLYYSTVKKHYKLAKNFKKISQDDQLI